MQKRSRASTSRLALLTDFRRSVVVTYLQALRGLGGGCEKGMDGCREVNKGWIGLDRSSSLGGLYGLGEMRGVGHFGGPEKVSIGRWERSDEGGNARDCRDGRS